MQELVAEVKELQRTSQQVKEAWAEYCEEHGGGLKDPSRHPQRFLEDFLDRVDAEAAAKEGRPEEGGERNGSVEEMAEKVKTMERVTEEGKQLWHWWCEIESGVTRFPERNPPAMLSRFLGMMDDGGALAKFRRRHAPGQQLVDRVNALQRSSPEFTAKWEQHCDENGSRTRDPRLHTSSFLEKFLDSNERQSGDRPPRAVGGSGGADFDRAGHGSSSSAIGRHQELVERVKDSQKESFKVRKLWHWFCEAEGNDVRDPAKHDARFLKKFLDMHADAEDLACTRTPSEDLLQKVRDAKRSTPQGNKVWEQYCDEHGGGTYDARMHSATFLWEFLDVLGAGSRDRGPPGLPPRDLVWEVKQVSKRSLEWKETWELFCDEHGEGTRDPKLHTVAFLRRFLDAAADAAHGAIAQASPQELEKHVGDVTRSSKEWRDLWHGFCDENGNKDYDPRKNDSIFLRRFLDTMADRADSPLACGGVAASALSLARNGRAEESEATDVEDYEGEQGELAERVRAAQKSSPRVREAWNEYCNTEGGGTCDPRRHPARFLRRFLDGLEDGAGRGAEEKPRDCGRQDESWEELAERVKSAQSLDRRCNLRWNEFCDEHGGGTKDPRKHSAVFLKDFLTMEDLEQKGLRAPRQREPQPPPQEAKPFKGGNVRVEEVQRKSAEEKTGLAADVEAAISSSSEVQDAWNEFADAKGCGVRDPGRHVASFLQRFLSSLERDGPAGVGAAAASAAVGVAAGGVGAGGGGGKAPNDLVERVRSAQRSSTATYEAWNRFCDLKGGGTRDPNRHPAPFLRQFLATVEGPGASRPQEEAPRREARPPQGQKRQREAPREGNDKAELIAQVKAIQKSSKRVNERWAEFCEEHGEGTRDPTRHDADFLRDFLDSLPAEWRKAKEDTDWNRRVRPRRNDAQEAAPREESKHELVEEIKELQRASKANTEAWREFCGKEGNGTCDPNRHPVAFLRRFLQRLAE